MRRDRHLRLVVRRTELVLTAGALGQLAALGLLVGLVTDPLSSAATAAAVGLTTMACAFLTVAGHEAGHAVAAATVGLGVRRIEIRGLLHGGVRRTTTCEPGAELLVCLAGPAASAALLAVGVALWALTEPGDLAPAVRTLAGASALALASSLWPGDGTDGTRARQAWRRRSARD